MRRSNNVVWSVSPFNRFKSSHLIALQDVVADETAFKQTQEQERRKTARAKEIQDNINKAREQNVRRKMDKAQNREWDSGKPPTASLENTSRKHSNGQEPSHLVSAEESALGEGPSSPRSPVSPERIGSGSWTRGGHHPRRGRGRGRGRVRGRRGSDNSRFGRTPSTKEDESAGNSEGKIEAVNATLPTPS